MSDISRIYAKPAPLASPPQPRAGSIADVDAPCDRVSTGPRGAVPGWSPDRVIAVQSRRHRGMVGGVFDALRGVPESGEGQSLTAAQVSTMAPFLAKAYHVPVDQARKGLESVHLYLGGPAANLPWCAVTLGHDIYVRSTDELKSIVSWDQRRWLAHECGHVMQTERTPTSLDEDSRMRRDLLHYGVHFLVDDKGGPGSLLSGFAHWANENVNPWNHDKTHISLGDAIHDAHVMEREAEKHGVAFAEATAKSPTLQR